MNTLDKFNLSCYYFFSFGLVTVCAGNRVLALVQRRVGVGVFRLLLLLTELLGDFIDVLRLFLVTSE